VYECNPYTEDRIIIDPNNLFIHDICEEKDIEIDVEWLSSKTLVDSETLINYQI
jgi:hypothetical protein